jgi:hypothetical protein
MRQEVVMTEGDQNAQRQVRGLRPERTLRRQEPTQRRRGKEVWKVVGAWGYGVTKGLAREEVLSGRTCHSCRERPH